MRSVGGAVVDDDEFPIEITVDVRGGGDDERGRRLLFGEGAVEKPCYDG